MNTPLPQPQLVSVPIDQIKIDEAVCGPLDLVLQYLMDQVYDGMCPLYFAQVPAALIVPYADCTKGEGPQKYDAAFRFFASQWAAQISDGSGPSILVYPLKQSYISSDDYQALYAYKKLGVETIPCWILGSPGIPGTLDIQGPAPVELARRIITGGTEDTQP